MKKIAVVTSSRSEYSLLYPLLKKLQMDQEVYLQLIVTGSHLSSDFGKTICVIRQDGFSIARSVDILSTDDTKKAMGKSVALGIHKFIDALEQLKPDALVVLGDRFEIFAVAQAAFYMDIPIFHISGGDTTLGVKDNQFRHCVSLMSQWHFVKLPEHKKKLLCFDIPSERIIIVGYLGIENIARLKIEKREQLLKKLNIPRDQKLALVTFHPVTQPHNSYDNEIECLLRALNRIPDLFCIFTAANEDLGGRKFNSLAQNFCKNHLSQSMFFYNLGRERYCSLAKYIDVIVGNSSSGILESGYFKKPVVNILPRQAGRLKNVNVLDVPNNAEKIVGAIERALSLAFKKKCQNMKNRYEVIPPKKISQTLLSYIKRNLLRP